MRRFLERYIEVLEKYAQFDGRAQREEYWMFTLVNILVSFAIGLVGLVGLVKGPYGINVLAVIYSVALIIPSLAVTIRRLHDTGRTGWWLLVGCVPIIGAIVLIVFAVQDSQPGTNEYGPNPKAAPA
ncbi:MAG: DUF805 domain-containing protein [Gemmatimonadaceae bacterium]